MKHFEKYNMESYTNIFLTVSRLRNANIFVNTHSNNNGF